MTDREEWLEWRRGGIGASDVAGILGSSPWSSPWSIWAEKVGLSTPEANEAMTAGQWLERAIGPWFEHETGLVVAGEQTQRTSPVMPIAKATVDGFVLPKVGTQSLDDALGLIEIKVTGPGRRWDDIPAHYQAQGQWQMFVTGLQNVWFAVLHGRRLEIYELARDDDWLTGAMRAVQAFWDDYVATGDPPPIDSSDATLDAIKAAYLDGSDTTVELDMADQLADLRAAKVEAKAIKARARQAESEIRELMGTHEVAITNGQVVATLRSQTRRTTCKSCGHIDESKPFRVLRPKETK